MRASPVAESVVRPWARRFALDRAWAAVLALAALALAFDLAVIQAFPPALDRGQTAVLWPLIANVAHGNGYVVCNTLYFPNCASTNQVTAMYEPLPILVFAGLAAVTHDSLWPIAVLQALVSAGVLVGVFLLTRHLAGPRPALLAAAIWTVYLPALRLVPQVAADLLASLWLTWGVVALAYAWRTDRRLGWVMAGACLGLGTLSRSAVLVVASAVVVGLLVRPPARGQNVSWRVRRAVLLVAVCGLVQLPWVLRNQVALGRPVVGSTLVGYNLFRGAHALTTPEYVRWVNNIEVLEAIRDLLARRPDLAGTENEAQLDAVYRQEALATIAEHPLRYIVLSADRFLMLWFDWRVSVTDPGPRLLGPMEYLSPLQQLLLLAAALIGVLATPVRKSSPLVLAVLVYCLSYMAVNAQQRYVVPVMPLVIALGGVGCAHVWQLVWAAATRQAAPRLAADAGWVLLVAGVRRLERETYALYLAIKDRRTPWYAKGMAIVGLVFGLGPVPTPKSLPALDRFIDVAPIFLGLFLARGLVPAAGLVAYRVEASEDLSRPRNGLIIASVVAGWVLLAGLAAALLIWDPV